METADGVLGRDPGDRTRRWRGAAPSKPGSPTSSIRNPSGIPQTERLSAEAGRGFLEVASLAGKAGYPGVEGGRRDGKSGRLDHASPCAARRGVREWEKGEEATRASCAIAVVEMIRVGRIEVDGALDQPEAQDAGIEIEVGCVGDRWRLQ